MLKFVNICKKVNDPLRNAMAGRFQGVEHAQGRVDWSRYGLLRLCFPAGDLTALGLKHPSQTIL